MSNPIERARIAAQAALVAVAIEEEVVDNADAMHCLAVIVAATLYNRFPLLEREKQLALMCQQVLERFAAHEGDLS